MKCIFNFIIFICLCTVTFSENDTTQQKKKSKSEKIPSNIWRISNFISEYHRKKFVEDVFQRIGQLYLTSVTDEDIPDSITVVNTLASVISSELIDKHIEKHRLREQAKNVSAQNETEVKDTSSNVEDTSKKYLASCEKYDYTGSPTVEIVNLTRFDEILTTKQNVTNRTMPAPCVLVLFYAHTCPFCAMAAPHFNALARAFPDIKMIAINTKKHQIINSQFGIVGVPTLVLFHNGRPVLKFNRKHYTLAQFSKFLSQYTGIAADSKMFLQSTDFGGPLPGIPKQETDYNLPLSWAVIGVWFLKLIYTSGWFQSINLPFNRRLGDGS